MRIRLKLAASVGVVTILSQTTNAALTQWRVDQGGNGHWYEAVVKASAVTWETARAEAEARGGYLATLTSSQEDAFVWGLVANRPELWANTFGGPWLGGYQPDPSVPAASGWVWVTGEAWNYTHWAAGEPNDAGWQGGRESYLQFRDGTGGWNDFTNDGNRVYSYVVEFAVPTPAVMPIVSATFLLRRRRV